MEAVLYLSEAPQASSILQNIRNELTNAIRTALLEKAYDTDVQLSFGAIHINSKGSVSQISFNGSDVTDIDSFIVKQAFKIDDDNYFDIRKEIKNDTDAFCFYPIRVGDRVSLTVLKSSPYFERKYGSVIHSDRIRVEYASKYMLIYCNSMTAPDVYYIGLFSPDNTANLMLEKAGKSLGGKSTVYYCFANGRPETFLHLGQVKREFMAYNPEQHLDSFNFYKGSVIEGIFKINKKTDSNGKIKVKETRKKCLQLIIKIQYGTVNHFCELHDIDELFFTAYLSGADGPIKHKNGDKITPKRLEEMLNLPFSPNAETLKDKNLLIRVDYDEIPE